MNLMPVQEVVIIIIVDFQALFVIIQEVLCKMSRLLLS